MFCFLISVFFSKANVAAAVGGILWFLSYIPYFFIIQYYNTMSLGTKTACCLFSNVAMAMGAQLIGKFEGAGIGAQWANLNQGPSIDDSLSLGLVMVMLVVDTLIYGLITWYIEAVFPGDYGVPQPWYFPVLPGYWCGRSKEVCIHDHPIIFSKIIIIIVINNLIDFSMYVIDLKYNTERKLYSIGNPM